ACSPACRPSGRRHPRQIGEGGGSATGRAEIEIDMQDDSRIRGAYRKSDDRTLVITEEGRDRSIEKQAVKRIYRVQTQERKRTGIVLAAGLGVGLLGAVIVAPAEERNEGTALLIGLPVGAAVGGLIGWALSGEDKHRELLYQAQ